MSAASADTSPRLETNRIRAIDIVTRGEHNGDKNTGRWGSACRQVSLEVVVER